MPVEVTHKETAGEQLKEQLVELESKRGSLLIAAFSAATAELLTLPIDTTKVFLQLKHSRQHGLMNEILPEYELGTSHLGLKKGHTHHNTMRRLGISNYVVTMKSIFENHGIAGFYRGWKPAILRASLNNALSATLYKPVRKLLGSDTRDCPLYIKLISGFATGSMTQILAAPTDLLKVRLQADSTRIEPRYTGVFDAIRTIYSKHGLYAFWRGLIPSMGRAGFAVSMTFGTYDHTKSLLLNHSYNIPMINKHYEAQDDISTHMIASLMSGFVATVVTCPFDVVKTRFQSQSITMPQYKTPTQCLKNILEKEGVLTLWRGFGPMYFRLAPWQVAFFITYEKLSTTFLGESF